MHRVRVKPTSNVAFNPKFNVLQLGCYKTQTNYQLYYKLGVIVIVIKFKRSQKQTNI